ENTETFLRLNDRLQNNIFRIIVIGEFKRGKSTFINTLIGEKLLPSGITPTTASINILKYGEKPKALIHLNDGSVSEIQTGELKSFVTAKNKEANKIKYAEIFYP